MATVKKIKKAQAGKEVGAEGRSRGSVAVGGTIRLDDKPKVKMAPAKIEKKYVPTAKESKNLKDATEMKNMRPTGPKTGRVKPTMGGAKNGKTMKKAQDGGYLDATEMIPKAGPMVKTKVKERSPSGDYVKKTVTRTRPSGTTKTTKVRRTLQGYLDGAPRANSMKSGGSMKKCKGGC